MRKRITPFASGEDNTVTTVVTLGTSHVPANRPHVAIILVSYGCDLTGERK